MRASRLMAVAPFTAALVIGPLCGAYRVAAQSSSGTGCLSFHEVHPTISAHEALQTRVPAGFRVYPTQEVSPWADKELLLREQPVMSGSDWADAQADSDTQTGEPVISFRLGPAGTRKFGQFTTANIGRPFAIVLDDRVISAPIILEPILGGQGQISGSSTVAETQRLAAKLKSGTCR